MSRIDVHLVAAGKFHDIDFARFELLKLLAEQPHIRTTVATDYADTDRIAACKFLITYTCDLMPTEVQTAAIRAFVEGGGRWIALHGTNSILRFTDAGVATPEDRPDVMEMLGSQFKAHPPIGAPFPVRFTDRDHMLTRGLDDFEVVDELYLMKMLAPVEVLADTEFSGEATGFVDAQWDEKSVPVLYLRKLGKGTILYNTLGHCRSHYDVIELLPFWQHPERCAWNYPVYNEMLRRAIRWGCEDIA